MLVQRKKFPIDTEAQDNYVTSPLAIIFKIMMLPFILAITPLLVMSKIVQWAWKR